MAEGSSHEATCPEIRNSSNCLEKWILAKTQASPQEDVSAWVLLTRRFLQFQFTVSQCHHNLTTPPWIILIANSYEVQLALLQLEYWRKVILLLPSFYSLCAPESRRFASVIVSRANCFAFSILPCRLMDLRHWRVSSRESAGHRLSKHTIQCPKHSWRLGKEPFSQNTLRCQNLRWPHYQQQIQKLKPTQSCVVQGLTHPFHSGCQKTQFLAPRKSHIFFSDEFPKVPLKSWQPLPNPSSSPFSHIPWWKTARVSSSG